jgi:salicylate hydroxylase
MAIEDGYVLGRCIEQWAHDPVAALQVYETARRERTTDVVKRSGNMAATFHNEALVDARAGAAYISQQWDLERIRNRYDSIYLYDAMSVPIASPVLGATEALDISHAR